MSSINVWYVYAPKAERNSATLLNFATHTVYPLRSQFKLLRGASSLEQMRLLGHVNTKSVWNAWIQRRTQAEQEKHCVQRDSQKAFQSTHRHYLLGV